MLGIYSVSKWCTFVIQVGLTCKLSGKGGVAKRCDIQYQKKTMLRRIRLNYDLEFEEVPIKKPRAIHRRLIWTRTRKRIGNYY